MEATAPQTVFIGSFADRGRAEHFVEQLRKAGFHEAEIGIVAPHPNSTSASVEDAALGGALAGGTVGVLAGLALAAGLIPGIGPVVAGGLLAGILGSAALGASAGGLLAALIALGVSEEQARHFEGQLRAGKVLVIVRAVARIPEALAIFRHCQDDGAAAAEPAPGGEPQAEPVDELQGGTTLTKHGRWS